MSTRTIVVSLLDVDRHDAHVLGIYAVPNPHGIAIPAKYRAISTDLDHRRYFEKNLTVVRESFVNAPWHSR